MPQIKSFLRTVVIAVVFASSGSSWSQDNLEQQEVLRVGVRSDAKPFAYIDEKFPQSSLKAYSGFAVDVCREVLGRLSIKYKVIAVPITVADRFFAIDNDRVDMICGPMSITQERMEKYVFSLPFFLSGISYATVGGGFKAGKNSDIVGILRRTTALLGLKELTLESLFGVYGKNIFEEIINKNNKGGKYIRELSSYDEGFRLLCAQKILYFVGDIDILTDNLSRFKSCNLVVSRKTITKEIYSVLFSRKFVFGNRNKGNGAKFFMGFQKNLFTIFQDGTINKFFEKNFFGKQQSNELRFFFESFRRRVK